MNEKYIPKVNSVVCGKFHYFNYIRFLYEMGWLKRFYFSGRLNSKKKLSIPSKYLYNAWIKEYLVQIQYKLLGNSNYTLSLFAHSLFDRCVRNKIEFADLTHVMIHGTSLKILKRAKELGSVIIGEPVNSHPYSMHQILSKAAEKWNVGFPVTMNPMQKKIINEIENIDFLLCPSTFIAESFINEGFPANRIEIIPWAVDITQFYPLGNKKDDVFRMIFVGQLSLRKGILDLLCAWEDLNLPNSELLVIGRLDSGIRHKIIFPKNVRYIGPVPHSTLNEYYNNSSVFILPSLEDGFGYVCLEAMASGLPVIVTSNTGARDLIDEGKNGWVIPPDNIDKLKEKILFVFNNQQLLNEMGKNARVIAKQDYSWEKYTEILIAYYKKLLNY